MPLLIGVHAHRESRCLHDHKSRSLSDAIELHVDTLKINAVQIMTHGPYNLKPNKFSIEDIVKLSKKVNIIIHGPYPAVSVWTIQPKTEHFGKVVRGLCSMFRAASLIGAKGVVIHLTRHPPDIIAQAVKRILKLISEKFKVTALLEMEHYRADELLTYETPEKLNYLEELIGDEDYYGWTVDTAHIWSAGVDCSSYERMMMWLKKIKNPRRIKQFHLNGSFRHHGSGIDKHAIPFCAEDQIFHRFVETPKQSGVYAVVRFAKKYGIPITCEINLGSEEDTKMCLKLIRAM